MLTRRELVRRGAAAVLAPLVLGRADVLGQGHSRLPRWRGFNLLEKFTLRGNAPYRESDFDLVAGWGFDFVRLPCDYRCWTEAPGRYAEGALKDIDRALAWGRSRRVHLNLCLHRAPGYCVNPPKEPLDLWADGEGGEEARRQFAAQWAMFAARYKGVPTSSLSFDLVNEPANVTAERYVRAVGAAVASIRSVDPARLVVADGLQYGTQPVHELVGLRVAQSTRGYAPFQFTHYRASWAEGSDKWPVPAWPLKGEGGDVWDRARLEREQVAPWKVLEKKGVGVHVGEWGVYNRTPHAAALAWMRDQLSLWRAAGWGWALWNLRGPFGPLDSERADVRYETYKGHKLDRAMLEVLRAG